VRFASVLSGGFITAIVVNPLELETGKITEVRFASLLSGGFITAIIVNPPERKLAKCTSVQCTAVSAAKVLPSTLYLTNVYF
jgi:hypothetical protein